MEFSVSVVIPVFNREKYIGEAIESVLKCSEVGEVIIVDDGSSDKTVEICEGYSKKFSFVKVFWHPRFQNLGPSASRNLGIQKAKLPYIAFLDSDDLYDTDRFKKDKIVFKSSPEVQAVFSCSAELGKTVNSSSLYGVGFSISNELGNKSNPVSFYEYVVRNKLVLFDTNSITLKRDFLLKGKLFDERLFLHQDIELWKRLMRKGRFCVGSCDKPVSFYRRHPDNRITSRSFQTYLKMASVHVDNVGVDNLFDFEINDLYSRIIRYKSQHFANDWQRRFYFYFSYWKNCFNKKGLLKNLIYSDTLD